MEQFPFNLKRRRRRRRKGSRRNINGAGEKKGILGCEGLRVLRIE